MGNRDRELKVRVIFKAMDIINGNACHFITFEEVVTKERIYLQVGMGNYMMVVMGDVGVLRYKENKKRYKSKFISFARTGFNNVEATLLEERYTDSLPALDEGVRAALEASDLKEDLDETVVSVNEETVEVVAVFEEEVIDVAVENEVEQPVQEVQEVQQEAKKQNNQQKNQNQQPKKQNQGKQNQQQKQNQGQKNPNQPSKKKNRNKKR
ncbi:MAG: hypothetical protein FWE07_01565 [Turicibacter sp.]|nr:hypothetical protein [Turicibacter sp.]